MNTSSDHLDTRSASCDSEPTENSFIPVQKEKTGYLK